MWTKAKSQLNATTVKTLDACFPDCPEKGDDEPIKWQEKKVTSIDECDLACTKDRKKVQYIEYVGPVHISLIDPPGYVYRKTMVETGLLNMAYFFVGATVMITLYFTLSFKLYWAVNFHIFMATLGSQIFMTAYFLILNDLDGPGIYLKSKDKRKEALFMNILGVIFVWVSMICLFVYKDYFLKVSAHCSIGMLGTITSVTNLCAACCLVGYEDSKLGRFAQILCVPSYLLLTITYITGIFKPSMVKWYPEKHMPAFLTVFCLLYTLIILYRPVKNFLKLM